MAEEKPANEQPEEEAVGELEEEAEEEEPAGAAPEKAKEPAAGEAVEEAKAQAIEERRDPLRVIEAALFLSNKQLNVAELALIARITVKRANELVKQLQEELSARNSAIEVVVENGLVSLQVKPAYLGAVAGLSKDTGLSRKSTKILGLIAKRGELLQSELKNYFRGEIYAYVTELKEAGYLTAEKKGNTRLLRPTKKFEESFQLSG